MPVNQSPKRSFKCGHRQGTWLSIEEAGKTKCYACVLKGRAKAKKTEPEAETATA